MYEVVGGYITYCTYTNTLPRIIQIHLNDTQETDSK